MRVIRLWLPVALCMTVLFVLSEQRGFDGVGSSWDKLLHVTAYTVLGLACLGAYNGALDLLRWRPTALALLTTIAYGLLDELHQSGVPGRDASFADWLADIAGALLALVLVGLRIFLRRKAGPARDVGH